MTKYDDRDLLMQDFMTVETNFFPKNGGNHTPGHTFSDFKFSTFAPLAFRYFLNLFGVKRDDFMVRIEYTLAYKNGDTLTQILLCSIKYR